MTSLGSEDTPFIITFCVRPSRKLAIHFVNTGPIPYSDGTCHCLAAKRIVVDLVFRSSFGKL